MCVRVERESKDEVLASRLLEGRFNCRPEVKIGCVGYRLQLFILHPIDLNIYLTMVFATVDYGTFKRCRCCLCTVVKMLATLHIVVLKNLVHSVV